MKKIICVMVLCVFCVYGGGDEGLSILKAKNNIKYLKALGIGYCLGYDVEKLYDELKIFNIALITSQYTCDFDVFVLCHCNFKLHILSTK